MALNVLVSATMETPVDSDQPAPPGLPIVPAARVSVTFCELPRFKGQCLTEDYTTDWCCKSNSLDFLRLFCPVYGWGDHNGAGTNMRALADDLDSYWNDNTESIRNNDRDTTKCTWYMYVAITCVRVIHLFTWANTFFEVIPAVAGLNTQTKMTLTWRMGTESLVIQSVASNAKKSNQWGHTFIDSGSIVPSPDLGLNLFVVQKCHQPR